MKKFLIGVAIGAFTATLAATAMAEEATVDMHLLTKKGQGEALGTIRLEDSPAGLLIHIDLMDTLSPGPHGFHVHENGSCDPAEKDGEPVPGLAAGGHFDPSGSGKHAGPAGGGHLGDLPILYVQIDEDGATATKETKVVPGLSLADIKGRSLMIHAGGDNYSDEPKPLGGGGARAACGVISS